MATMHVEVTTGTTTGCARAVDDLACGHPAESHIYEHEDMVYSRIFECRDCRFEADDWYNAHLPCATCNPPDRQPLAPGPPFMYANTDCWDMSIRRAFARHGFESVAAISVTQEDGKGA